MPPPLLALVGPTASGKSAVALALAAEVGGAIVSCDSVQVYRGFDIGCAKPTAAERQRVPHHLLDVAEWHEGFDAARYRRLALAALASVRGEGRIPIVCGGTGLYLRALRWGLLEAPGPDPGLRARLYAEERASPGTLHARLRELDPPSARDIDPHNLVRIVRALELTLLSGEPASRLRARHGFGREEVPMRVVALDWPMPMLRSRIAERTEAMLVSGLLDEVEVLLAKGVTPEARPMRAVGYKEACEVVLGHAPRAGLEERIVRATTAYARRQRTWLRRERDVVWVTITESERALAAVRALNLAASREMG